MIILKILLWIWQLPQNIIGFIISRFAREEDDGVFTKMNFFGSGVCLGEYIILERKNFIFEINILHEKGHRVQSRILGPLYLLIVGLPSLLRNLIDRKFHKSWPYCKRASWYYSGFPEKWADKLGGVNRGILNRSTL